MLARDSNLGYLGRMDSYWGLAMNQSVAFDDVLDAAEQLDVDAQAELVAILSRRLAERGRQRVMEAVAQARQEFAAGQCPIMTATEIVREALA
jgi:hypothetical protein